MSVVNNYFQSTYGFLKSSAKFALKVATVEFAGTALAGVLRATGLNRPINVLARAVEPLSSPLVDLCIKVTEAVSRALPTVHYQAEFAYPDKLNEIFPCEVSKTRLRMFDCRWNLESIVAGITEEIIFRGILQKGILPKVASLLPGRVSRIVDHKWSRIFLTSLLFGAGHYQGGATDVVHQFSGGVLYGHAYELTNHLGINIAAHMLNNGLMYFPLGLFHIYATKES